MAHLVVVSYNGRAPKKQDVFFDFPVSRDALNLVGRAKRRPRRTTRRIRRMETGLYGIQGQIVRVALPGIVAPQSRVAYNSVRAKNETTAFKFRTQRMHNLGATAKKNLEDDYPQLVVRAVARAAFKLAASEGLGRGTQAAVNSDSLWWVGLLVTTIARMFALATEEADKRIWQTLPGEIQLARFWVPPGAYTLTLHSFDRLGNQLGASTTHDLTLGAGETKFVTQRVVF